LSQAYVGSMVGVPVIPIVLGISKLVSSESNAYNLCLEVVFTRAADIRLKKGCMNLTRINQSPGFGIQGSYPILTRCKEKKLVASDEGRISQGLGIELIVC
jgi:hypothetical protein